MTETPLGIVVGDSTDHEHEAQWHLSLAQSAGDKLEVDRQTHALLAIGHAVLACRVQLDDIAAFLCPPLTDAGEGS